MVNEIHKRSYVGEFNETVLDEDLSEACSFVSPALENGPRELGIVEWRRSSKNFKKIMKAFKDIPDGAEIVCLLRGKRPFSTRGSRRDVVDARRSSLRSSST